MLRVKSFHRPSIQGGAGTQIMVESDELLNGEAGEIGYLLLDGILETYLDPYGFPPGAVLIAMLLDAFYEDIEVPHWREEGASERFQEIVAMESDRIEWQCDKNALLSMVTIDQDDPEQMAGTWLAVKQESEERAEGWERFQEERAAAEFVDSLPEATRRAPRDNSLQIPAETVGLAIQFV